MSKGKQNFEDAKQAENEGLVKANSGAVSSRVHDIYLNAVVESLDSIGQKAYYNKNNVRLQAAVTALVHTLGAITTKRKDSDRIETNDGDKYKVSDYSIPDIPLAEAINLGYICTTQTMIEYEEEAFSIKEHSFDWVDKTKVVGPDELAKKISAIQKVCKDNPWNPTPVSKVDYKFINLSFIPEEDAEGNLTIYEGEGTDLSLAIACLLKFTTTKFTVSDFYPNAVKALSEDTIIDRLALKDKE